MSINTPGHDNAGLVCMLIGSLIGAIGTAMRAHERRPRSLVDIVRKYRL